MTCRLVRPARGSAVFRSLGTLVAALGALFLAGCGHVAPVHRGLLASTRALEPASQPPTGTGDGAAPRTTPTEPVGAPATLEDASKKSASLETSGYLDSDRVAVLTPAISGTIENVVDGASLHGSYLVDVVSAASVDIIATASKRWHEVRHAGTLSGEYKPHNLGVGFSAAVSSEPDYLSYGGAGHLSYDLNEKNTTLFFGYGYGHDTAGRGGTPFTVFARPLQRGSFVGGVNQIIDASTLASFSLSVIIENGDQSKPYRYVPMFSPAEAANVPLGASINYVNSHRLFERPLEQLPLSRRRFAFSSELAHRFEASTIRANERLYVDTWGLKASTTDARWFFDLGDRVRVWPHTRFHVQTPTVFWQRAYVSEPAPAWSLPQYRTGDRELGPLWSADGGGGTKVFLGSAENPHLFAIGLEADVIYTAYLDDLFITNRTAFLGALTLTVGEQ